MPRSLLVSLIAGSIACGACADMGDAPSEYRPGMSFPTEDEAYRFIANRTQALGLGSANLKFGSDGKVVGLRMDGTTSDIDPRQQQLVDELGGTNGEMFVSGKTIVLRPPPESGDSEIETVERAVSSCGGSYCTEDSSVMSSSFFGTKKEIGGRTVQKTGVKYYTYLTNDRCPTECSSWSTGESRLNSCRCRIVQNHLSISNRYYMWAGNGYGNGFMIEGLPEQFGAAPNVGNYFVGHTEWSFRADGRVKEIDGVCTLHQSRGEGGASQSVTFAGDVPESCKRGIY